MSAVDQRTALATASTVRTQTVRVYMVADFARQAQSSAPLTLWIKRADEGSAWDYAALKGIDPALRVDELKALWLASLHDERAQRVDPSRVVLHLVTYVGGRPSMTDEATAAALLPWETLQEQGVVDEAKLLGRLGGLSSRLLGDLLGTAFSDKAIIRRMYERFSNRIVALDGVEDEALARVLARNIYIDTQRLPSTTTSEHFSAEGYQLDGHLHEGSNLVLCFKGLAVHLLKPLDKAEYERAKALQDRQSAAELPECAHIVPFELRKERDKFFMIMPKLVITVEPIMWLAPEHADRLVTQLAEALSYLHALGFAHADVKPANVCLRDPETFVLIDIGSVARFGDHACSTRAYVPSDLPGDSELRCTASLDWWMLDMMLGEKCCARNACLDMGSGVRDVTRDVLQKHLHKHLPVGVFALWEQGLAKSLHPDAV